MRNLAGAVLTFDDLGLSLLPLVFSSLTLLDEELDFFFFSSELFEGPDDSRIMFSQLPISDVAKLFTSAINCKENGQHRF